MPPADPRFDPADPLISADFAGWWRRGFAIVRRGWRVLALMQLCAIVPGLVLMIPSQLLADLAARDERDGGDSFGTGETVAATGALLVASVLMWLIYSVAALATARLVVTIATGAQVSFGQAVRAALPRVPALIGWTLLSGLILLVAVLACILPVIYVGAVFVVLPVVVLFERGNVIARCFKLFNHDLGAAVSRVGAIAGLGIGIGLAFVCVSCTWSGILWGSTFLDTSAVTSTGAVIANSLVGTVLNAVASLICGIVLTPLTVATYADLRARLEPFTTAHLPAA
ncbi:hypothetical protein Areg01_84490 [Actinoplanes regularis]|nr:hypothetical protein Areg01_84490 [Actinoplanes regularis]